MLRSLLQLLLVAAVAAFGTMPGDNAVKAIEKGERQSYMDPDDCSALQDAITFFARTGSTQFASAATYDEAFAWRARKDAERLAGAMAGSAARRSLQFFNWQDYNSYDWTTPAANSYDPNGESGQEEVVTPQAPEGLDVVLLEYSIAMAIESGVDRALTDAAETKLHDELLLRVQGGSTAAACADDGSGRVTVVNVGCAHEEVIGGVAYDVVYAAKGDGTPTGTAEETEWGSAFAVAQLAATEVKRMCSTFVYEETPPGSFVCDDLAEMTDVRAVPPGVSTFYKGDKEAAQTCGSEQFRNDSPEVCESSYELEDGPWKNPSLETFTARKCKYTTVTDTSVDPPVVSGACVPDEGGGGSATCPLPDPPPFCQLIADPNSGLKDVRDCGDRTREQCRLLVEKIYGPTGKRGPTDPDWPQTWEWCNWSNRGNDKAACEKAYATRHAFKTNTSFTVQRCVHTGTQCRTEWNKGSFNECLRAEDSEGNVPKPSEALISRWLWRKHALLAPDPPPSPPPPAYSSPAPPPPPPPSPPPTPCDALNGMRLLRGRVPRGYDPPQDVEWCGKMSQNDCENAYVLRDPWFGKGWTPPIEDGVRFVERCYRYGGKCKIANRAGQVGFRCPEEYFTRRALASAPSAPARTEAVNAAVLHSDAARKLQTESFKREYRGKCGTDYCYGRVKLQSGRCLKIVLQRDGNQKIRWSEVEKGPDRDALATAIAYNSNDEDVCKIGRGATGDNGGDCWTEKAEEWRSDPNPNAPPPVPVHKITYITCP